MKFKLLLLIDPLLFHTIPLYTTMKFIMVGIIFPQTIFKYNVCEAGLGCCLPCGDSYQHVITCYTEQEAIYFLLSLLIIEQ